MGWILAPEFRGVRLPKCCVCGSTEKLRVAPLMTGDDFGEEAKCPVCSICYQIWFTTGETTVEGILKYRRRNELSSSHMYS